MQHCLEASVPYDGFAYLALLIPAPGLNPLAE